MAKKALRPALTGGVLAAFCCLSWPGLLAQDNIEGVFALPGSGQGVTGQLHVSETGPLTRRIELTYADRLSGEQVTDFDVELTQQLHILATDAALGHLIHEHADVIGADGRFIAELSFPEPGLYHIYTDATPTGFGQQVLRFDVAVGGKTFPEAAPPSGQDISRGTLTSSDGPYSVTLDASQLRAGMESMVSLLVEKDGMPADDLEPYLGVSAHAVFIRADDLTYVHAHASEAGNAGAHDAHGGTNAPTAEADSDDHGGHEAASAHDTHSGHETAPTTVDPAMSLHVTPPAAGIYALWIEFIGGGEIRTVPFAIDIPQADPHASH